MMNQTARNRALVALQELQAGTYGPGGQIRDQIYYDRFILDGTTPVTRHDLFVVPLGQGGKTLADTNYRGTGNMPQGNHYAAYGIFARWWFDIEMSGAALNDWYNNLAFSTVQVDVNNVDPQFQIRMQDLVGVPAAGAITAAAIAHEMSQGQYGRIWPINTPIVLAANTSWSIQVNHHYTQETVLDGCKCWIGLHGLLAKTGG